MPHRFQSLHEALAILLTSIGAAVAAAGGYVAQIPISAFNGPAIYDNDRLRVICIIGALGGAVLNLGLYPSKTPGIRPMVWQVTGSAMSGVIFTPVAIHWLGITPNIDNLLAVSFVMAIVSVGLLRKAIPVWMWVLGNRLGFEANGNGGASNPDDRNDGRTGSPAPVPTDAGKSPPPGSGQGNPGAGHDLPQGNQPAAQKSTTAP